MLVKLIWVISMAHAAVNRSWIKSLSDNTWSGRAPAGDKLLTGIAPYSRAILSGGTLLRSWDFADGQVPATSSTFFAFTNSGGVITAADGYLAGVIPAGSAAGSYCGASLYLDSNGDQLQELYIKFKARFPKNILNDNNRPNTPFGIKFLKIKGKNNAPSGYANFTFGLTYNTGEDQGGLLVISYGDGTGTGNDTQKFVDLTGINTATNVGRGFNQGRRDNPTRIRCPHGVWPSTAWADGDWHDFRVYCRYNSGDSTANEIADGAFYLEIDGQMYADIAGIFNRNPDNSDIIDTVSIWDNTQNPHAEFELDYDDIVFSVGGFL